MTNYTGILAAAVSVTVATVFAAPAAVAETWKCYTYQPAPASPVNVGLGKMADQIKKITDGRVNINCSVGGALPIGGSDIAPAVSDGILDFGTVNFVSGYVPIANMGYMPGLFTDNAQYDAVGWPIFEPLVEKGFAEKGIKLLGLYHYPVQMLFGSSSAPALSTLTDLKGKKVRIGNPEQGGLVEHFGGIPISIATADVATSLQRGAVDYVITAAFAGGRLWEDSLGSALSNSINIATSYMVMNMETWNDLSAEEQEAIQAAATETTKWITDEQDRGNAASLEAFAAKEGWTVTPVSPEIQAEIATVMEPIWQDWAENTGDEAVTALGELKSALGY